MYTHLDDTIVAISSAPGHGMRGIVRLSGPRAVEIADAVFTPDSSCGSNCEVPLHLSAMRPFAAYEGVIRLDERTPLPALAVLFRAPRSYTRQDLVEIHTIGSPPVLELLVERSIAAGARPAEPGEFTARAVMAGAMTLAGAEAVAATIRARSDAQLRAARRLLRGELTERVTAWQDELVDLLALVVADIDFAEEPIDFISPPRLRAALGKIQEQLAALLVEANAGARLDVLPRILLLGPPNAGKSTLLNALSGMNRAITSAVAGTTRDVLEAPVRLGALEAILLDAAGIDDDLDEILAAGRQRAFDAAARVEAIALVADACVPLDEGRLHDLAARGGGAAAVVVLTKSDRVPPAGIEAQRAAAESLGLGPVAVVSALTGAGLDALRKLLAERLGGVAPGEGEGLMLSARQRSALAEAEAALARAAGLAAEAAETIDCAELIAVELQEALDAFATLTGAVTTEDLLGRIFANFCIGK